MNGIGKLLSRTLRVFAKDVHENAVNHGWWEDERSWSRAIPASRLSRHGRFA